MTVDEIYSKIGQEMFNVIEGDVWTNARLEFKIVGNGVVGYTGEYIENNEVKNISIRNITRELSVWIKELHEITTGGGNNKWNRAFFTINSGGNFGMEFIWDKELNDEIERLN
ncbi:hypothetical protein SAMN02927937_00550 [Paenimyroides aquimaris]|uniref:DUF600 family protein n=1 Tax=Paenimyroides marinum TaxID=1159016 RepID=A0A1H6JJ07_9FLAO|nr:hypothetical protein [Paenimyroides aquimaris]SEH62275.1 hypothetical protein SAMN02927937_00550 [Paenimyroides aquimaris]